jgi:hypothetical protein
LKYSTTDEKMELDIFLPKEQLAFEYQGEQHFRDVYGLGNHSERIQKDKEKEEQCRLKGIILIKIPYWWDKTLSSLATTIQQQRGDVIFEYKGGETIPRDPPTGFPTGL